MLSFLNSVGASNNGKTGPVGDTAKKTLNGDTSGEESMNLSNGTAADKKRKKGKQHAPAAKIAKLMAAVPIDTTATLQSIDIIIPTLDAPKEDEEKVVEIPSMNSPLFKDIPSKNVESSSDLTSSSEGSSSSDDSSSSDNDSDNEEEEKKDINASSDALTPALEEDPSNLRIPIKLTISNLGKPSAKVVTIATGEVTDINFSDSETDMDYNEIDRQVKVQTNSSLEGDTNDSPAIAKSDQSDIQNEWLNESHDTCDSYMKHIDLNQHQNHPGFTNVDKGVGDSKVNFDFSIDSVDKSQKTDNSKMNWITVKYLDVSKTDNDHKSESILENYNPTYISSKNVIDFFKNGNTEELNIEKQHSGKPLSHDTDNAVGSLPYSKEMQSSEDKCVNSNLDSALPQDSSEIKYCPDGFILAPALSKSPDHLKATLRISLNVLDTVQTKDGSSNGILKTEVCSKTDNVNEPKPLVTDCKQTALDKPKTIFQEDCKPNLSTDNLSSQKDDTLNKISEKEKSNKTFSLDKCHNSEIKDHSVNLNIRDSSDRNSDKTLVNSKCEELSHEIIHNTVSIDAAKVSGPKCKDTTVSSQPLLRNAATKITTSITTNSGSIMSATSRSSTKTGGCTNGIPDKENPFITWTKCDDRNYGFVDGSLPASSLVQALARVPFPTLSPHGESSVPQISPLGVAVPQLSPLCLAGLSPGSSQLSRMSPGSQMPILSPPSSQRLRSSPGHTGTSQQVSSDGLIYTGSSDGKKATLCGEGKNKSSQKSGKRTSRLSNIIDSLRTSKEKEAAVSNLMPEEQNRKGAMDILAGTGRKSPSALELSSVTGQKSSSSSASSSPIFSASFASDPRSSSEKLLLDSLGFPHQISADPCHMITSTLSPAIAQTIDYSFHALKDDLEKEKIMLENLEMMKNGLLDPYCQPALLDSKSRKLDSGHSQIRSKSSVSSSSTPVLSAPSLSSRPSSHQSKSSNQTYLSASSASPSSSRTSTTTTTSSSNLGGSSINSAMYHLAPSAALSAAHLELNAAAANIFTFQHMYGMQDPYMMKTLMSNPLYLQRMMEFQKQAMDPLFLRQLEMYEAVSAIENSKNTKEQQAMNAQSLLWQAHAASIIQQQHMQQIQQLQLHHQQQQLQQQVAAVRERETRETIAAIIASKNSNLSTHTNKSSGSISTGQSAKSLMASATSTSSLSLSSSKRPRSAATPSSVDNYSRGFSSLEKKLRPSHQNTSHISNYTNFTSSPSTPHVSSPSTFRHAQMSNKPAGNSVKSHSSTSISSTQAKQEFLQLSAAASPHLWEFPTLLQPPSLDMTHMSRFFEQPNDTKSASLSVGHAGTETAGPEVLDLSVKPRTGKT